MQIKAEPSSESAIEQVSNHQPQLLSENEQLKHTIELLQQEKYDLQVALSTITEHGDCVEAQLHETNLILQKEVVERKRVQNALQSLLDVLSSQRDDLEVIVQTIMEHGDILDHQWRQKLCQANEEASLDALTKIPNRRSFNEHLAAQWKQMSQEKEPLSLVLCDIDFFKQFNDAYGHLAGDECLTRVAQTLHGLTSRPNDLAARYGGEEFAAILPHTNCLGALKVAERMQIAIAKLQIPHEQSAVSPYLTLSIGVACTVPQAGRSPTMLINESDQLLYIAKQQGRNRISS
jgi:diguanylate cyclase (GGDEF)-like protein